MFCIECGKQNPDKAKFCAFCGTKLYTGSDAAPKPDITFRAESPVDDTPPWEDVSKAEPVRAYTHVSIGAYDTEADPQVPLEIKRTPEAVRAEGYTGKYAESSPDTAAHTGRHAHKTAAQSEAPKTNAQTAERSEASKMNAQTAVQTEAPKATAQTAAQSEAPKTTAQTSELFRSRLSALRTGTIVPAMGENPAQPAVRSQTAATVKPTSAPAETVHETPKAEPVPDIKKAEPAPVRAAKPDYTVQSPLTKSDDDASSLFFDDDDDEDFGAKSRETPLFDRVKALFTRRGSDEGEEDPFADEEESDEVDELEAAIGQAQPRKTRTKIIYDDDDNLPGDDDDISDDDDDSPVSRRSPRDLLGKILGGGNDEVLTSTGTERLPSRGRAGAKRRDTHIPEMTVPRKRARDEDDDDFDEFDGADDYVPEKKSFGTYILTGLIILAMCVCLWLFATQSGGEFLAGLNMSGDAEDYYHLGNTARANGQIKRAADAYYSALCLDNDNYDYALQVGITQQQIGEYDKAIKAYYLCTTLDSEKPEPYMYLVKLYTAMGDTESAENFRRLGKENTISAMFD